MNSRREIGIRIAVGGTSRDVLALFLRRDAKLVVCGLVIGLGGSAASKGYWAANSWCRCGRRHQLPGQLAPRHAQVVRELKEPVVGVGALPGSKWLVVNQPYAVPRPVPAEPDPPRRAREHHRPDAREVDVEVERDVEPRALEHLACRTGSQCGREPDRLGPAGGGHLSHDRRRWHKPARSAERRHAPGGLPLVAAGNRPSPTTVIPRVAHSEPPTPSGSATRRIGRGSVCSSGIVPLRNWRSWSFGGDRRDERPRPVVRGPAR
jgi:hypothetical protein